MRLLPNSVKSVFSPNCSGHCKQCSSLFYLRLSHEPILSCINNITYFLNRWEQASSVQRTSVCFRHPKVSCLFIWSVQMVCVSHDIGSVAWLDPPNLWIRKVPNKRRSVNTSVCTEIGRFSFCPNQESVMKHSIIWIVAFPHCWELQGRLNNHCFSLKSDYILLESWFSEFLCLFFACSLQNLLAAATPYLKLRGRFFFFKRNVISIQQPWQLSVSYGPQSICLEMDLKMREIKAVKEAVMHV